MIDPDHINNMKFYKDWFVKPKNIPYGVKTCLRENLSKEKNTLVEISYQPPSGIPEPTYANILSMKIPHKDFVEAFNKTLSAFFSIAYDIIKKHNIQPSKPTDPNNNINPKAQINSLTQMFKHNKS